MFDAKRHPDAGRFQITADNIAGYLPHYMSKAGLIDVCERGHLNTIFGTLAFHSARRS